MTLLNQRPTGGVSPEAEALFKEAQQRRKRRRLLVFGIGLWVLIGTGVGYGLSNHASLPAHHRAATTKPFKAIPAEPRPNAGVVPEQPDSLAVGPNGNLYIGDDARNQIIERSANGSFVVIAGTGKTGFSGDGKPAVHAQLNDPGGMVFGLDGTLYFADVGNHRLRAISPGGVISTVAGGGNAGTQGFVPDGTPALQASFNPLDVAMGPGRHLYVSTGEQVLRLEADGTLTAIVGTQGPYQGTYGVGGPAVDASADGVEGITFDSAGDLYLWGFNSKTWFIVTANGIMTEPAGTENLYPRGDGGLVTAPDGSVYAMGELSIVRLSPSGQQTVVSFYPGLFHGIRGFSPNGMAIGSDGTIYVDTGQDGFANQTAIASIAPTDTSSQIIWEAPR